MTKIIADQDQHISLAYKLWKAGLNSEQAFQWIKERKYTINNVEYFGKQVSTCVRMLERLDSGARNGLIKCTKSNGLTIQNK